MRANYIEDLEKWKSEFEFSVPLKVRFSETDMFGHLNNTVTFAYFEFARIEYLKHIGLMDAWMASDGVNIPVVADLRCDYTKQVFFDQELSIHVKPAGTGTSSVEIHYMAMNEKNEIVFTGRGAIVQISRQSGRSVPWTEEEKNYFNAVNI
jgi:acyl-CoA thioester hydrolase